MNNVKNMHRLPLICKCDKGFYPIDPAPTKYTEEEYARLNGERNAHINSIEDFNGVVLWERK